MQTVKLAIVENAVRAYRLADGRNPALTDRDLRRCVKLTRQCQAGLVTRADIAGRIHTIAGARR